MVMRRRPHNQKSKPEVNSRDVINIGVNVIVILTADSCCQQAQQCTLGLYYTGLTDDSFRPLGPSKSRS